VEAQTRITEGSNVYGSDGEKVGSVIAIEPAYIVVEKGFFFPTDYYIPVSAISTVAEDGVYLSVTKEAALNQGWDSAPAADYATTNYAAGEFADASLVGSDVAAGVGMTSGATDADTIRVPVYEEELTATTRERELGDVRVIKDVVTEEQSIDVPVTEERIRVTRRTVDRPATAADAFEKEEIVIEVPVHSEEVDVQKRVRVAEEVEIAKERVQRTEHVTDRVRREEVRIDDATTGAGTEIA
jgi:uncharacterized protein (TIGR02271 family)